MLSNKELRQISQVLIGWLSHQKQMGGLTETSGWTSTFWQEAVRLIQYYGVACVLRQRLEEREMYARLPEEFQQDLERIIQRQESNPSILTHWLTVLQLLQQQGIDVLPCGDCAFIFLLDEEVTDRSLENLDLSVLVRPNSEARLWQYLEDTQWVNETDESGAFRKYVRYQNEKKDELVVYTAVVAEEMGLHYDMTSDYLIAAKLQECQGQSVLLSGKQAIMHHLLMRVGAELMAQKLQLSLLLDVSRLAKRLSMSEWKAIVLSAKRKQDVRFLYAALVMSTRVSSTGVPSWVLRDLAPSAPLLLKLWLDKVDIFTVSSANFSPRSFLDYLVWFPLSGEVFRVAWAILKQPKHPVFSEQQTCKNMLSTLSYHWDKSQNSLKRQWRYSVLRGRRYWSRFSQVGRGYLPWLTKSS